MQNTHTERTILQTRGLTKRYGSTLALDNVSIELREHHIYGFIGENGAGKSTLMKIISGLVFPTSGDYTLMGAEKPEEIEKKRKLVGTIIEEPALFPKYTVRQNVELQRIIVGNPDQSVTDKVIEMVGLTDASDKKAKNLSMGMKQRLGIAIAMVGNPQMLILDEPINGLDPKNIVALRSMLKRINEQNECTIFVSSHILSELYLLATDFIFIHKGRIIETATHEELEEKCSRYLIVKDDDLPRTTTILDKHFPGVSYTVTADDTVKIYGRPEMKAELSKHLMEAGIIISELSDKEQSLEEYFLTLTGGAANA